MVATVTSRRGDAQGPAGQRPRPRSRPCRRPAGATSFPRGRVHAGARAHARGHALIRRRPHPRTHPPASAQAPHPVARVNPLAFLLGRFGDDIEYLFAKYFALVGNLTSTGPSRSPAPRRPLLGLRRGRRALLPGRGGRSSASSSGLRSSPGTTASTTTVTAFPCKMPGSAASRASPRRRPGLHRPGAASSTRTPRPYPNDFDSIVSFVIGSGVVPRLLLTAGSTFR